MEAFKIFIVFSACLLSFYYGILWLSETYEGDDRLRKTETDARQVWNGDAFLPVCNWEKDGNAVEDGPTRFYSLLSGGKGACGEHPPLL
ncbi:DUF4227 family protein [Salibacterium qingdaonense]|uniref:DUF4227 family protein n=1 Tax=Salibacterium qingdaonense TaxID=266892 RepID=UPI003899DECE